MLPTQRTITLNRNAAIRYLVLSANKSTMGLQPQNPLLPMVEESGQGSSHQGG